MDLLQKNRIDPMMPLVAEVVAEILQAGDVVAPLDVLVRLEIIDPAEVEIWRRGGHPYLERGIKSGLARVARLLRLVNEHARSLGLTPTPGKYLRRGTGANRRLRFSKRGDADSEAAYSTHFVRPRNTAPA
jgi:hypothetical protein